MRFLDDQDTSHERRLRLCGRVVSSEVFLSETGVAKEPRDMLDVKMNAATRWSVRIRYLSTPGLCRREGVEVTLIEEHNRL